MKLTRKEKQILNITKEIKMPKCFKEYIEENGCYPPREFLNSLKRKDKREVIKFLKKQLS